MKVCRSGASVALTAAGVGLWVIFPLVGVLYTYDVLSVFILFQERNNIWSPYIMSSFDHAYVGRRLLGAQLGFSDQRVIISF